MQNAGGIYGLVALSPSVGCYEGGRFASHVPIRVVQPAAVAVDNHNAGVKLEHGTCTKRKRQATLPLIMYVVRSTTGIMAWGHACDCMLARGLVQGHRGRGMGTREPGFLMIIPMLSPIL